MNVGQVTQTANYSSSESAKTKSDSMGKDQFLTMLITQLKNQDPLSPMENAEFTSQMAQFSSLEQLFSVNENLVGLQHLSNSMNNTQALNLIGKEIEADGDLISVGDGTASSISFILPEAAAEVRINIKDKGGQTVKSISLSGMTKGPHEISWDAKNNRGGEVAAGLYTYSVSASSYTGDELKADTFMRGTVDAVSVDGNITYLHVGEKEVMLSEVTKILQAPKTGGLK